MKYDIKDLLRDEETAKNAAGTFPAADKKTGERIYKLTTEKLAAKRGIDGKTEAYAVTRVTRKRGYGAFAAAAAALAVCLAAGGIFLSRDRKKVPAVEDAPVIIDESSEPVSGAPSELREAATSASDKPGSDDADETSTAPSEEKTTAKSGEEEKTPGESKPAVTAPSQTGGAPAANEPSAPETPAPVEPAPEETDERLLYLRKNDDPAAPLVKDAEVLENDMSLFQVKNLLSLRRREAAENCRYEWLEHEFLNDIKEYEFHADLPLLLEFAHEAMGDYDLTAELLSYRQPYPDKIYSDANGNEVREYWANESDSVTMTFYPAEKKIVYRGTDLNEKKTVYIEKDIIGSERSFLYPFAPDQSLERRRAAYDKAIEEYESLYPNGTPLRKLMIATGAISPNAQRLTFDKFSELLETCENASELWATLYRDYIPDVAGHTGPSRYEDINDSNYEYWLDDDGEAAVIITSRGEYYYAETADGCIPGETCRFALPW